ncbi:hypothetical protein BDC45DRAFT_519245 [Circinella umbellata]|nr:hypothetical protein BDC45DRAFT_519245 [Circinella umbellata]
MLVYLPLPPFFCERIMALAFLGVHKSLALEARWLTLDLYRSLIKSTRQLKESNQHHFLINTIRERFRFHKHESSRPRVLGLLREGNEALRILEEAPHNSIYMERIDALAEAKAGPLKHSVEKLRRIPNLKIRALAIKDIRSRTSKRRDRDPKNHIPGSDSVRRLARLPDSLMAATPNSHKEENKKKPKMIKRKPYQVLKTVTTQGFTFKRLRGWRQPVKTSMMLKKRVKKTQQWIDQQQNTESLLDIISHERLFYDALGIKDDLKDYKKSLLNTRSHYKTLRVRRLGPLNKKD